MNGAAWAGIAVGICGFVSSLAGMYSVAKVWILRQGLLPQRLGFFPTWFPTVWIPNQLRKLVRKRLQRWVDRRGLQRSALEHEITGTTDAAVFWVVLGAFLMALGSLIVGVAAR